MGSFVQHLGEQNKDQQNVALSQMLVWGLLRPSLNQASRKVSPARYIWPLQISPEKWVEHSNLDIFKQICSLQSVEQYTRNSDGQSLNYKKIPLKSPQVVGLSRECLKEIKLIRRWQILDEPSTALWLWSKGHSHTCVMNRDSRKIVQREIRVAAVLFGGQVLS